jgi:concentrative nucleoside transporter, CNT family
MLWDILRAILGVGVLLAVAWAFSTDRRAMPWKLIAAALLTQVVAGLLLFHVEAGRMVFSLANRAVTALLDPARKGAEFVFGPLADPPGSEGSIGFVFAFQALPTAIFFAALTGLLYYAGIMQRVVRAFARFFQRTLGVTGVEATTAAGNIFVGIEALLTVRPYLEKARPHELAVVLTAGMATIASTVLGLYVGMLQPFFPSIAGHLLTANLLSAPAAVMMARILVPAPRSMTDRSGLAPEVEFAEIRDVSPDGSVAEALTRGANDGLKLALGITAVLVAFVGLLALLNGILGEVGGWFQHPGLTLESLLAWVFLPFVWLIGVPGPDAFRVAELLSLRVVATEVPAYMALAESLEEGLWQNPRSAVIAAYALCGFAHIPSLGVFVGGLCALVPDQRSTIGKLAWRALLAATLACLLTGAVAGLLLGGDTPLTGPHQP